MTKSILEEKIQAYRQRDQELATKYKTAPAVILAIKGMAGMGYNKEKILDHFKIKAANLSKHKNHNPARLAHAKDVVVLLSVLGVVDWGEINKPVEVR